MTFKLKSDTIFIIRYALEEIYYLKKVETAGEVISRTTLFQLTKKFTNKQLSIYKELPINETKRYRMSFEIHEAVLLKSILINEISKMDNQYSIVLMRLFIEELLNWLNSFNNLKME